MTYLKKVSVLAVAISGAIASVQPVFAQGGAAAELEEVVVMGSRSNKPRSATESTVPVDVFSEAELNAFGNQADITCLLYTSPSPRDLSTSRMPSSA